MTTIPKPYSPATLAERWSCSTQKVRTMIARGEIAAFRYGKSHRIPVEEVDRIEGVAPPELGAEVQAEPPPPNFRPPERVIEMHRSPARWPQMMKRRTAAEYLDMSEAALEREVIAGRLPMPVILGGRDHWHKEAIDSALRSLVGGLEVEPEYLREHRERYGKGK